MLIKAGSYRFNDVFTLPGGTLEQGIEFSFSTFAPDFGISVFFICDTIKVGIAHSGMSYRGVYAEPDISSMGFVLPAWSKVCGSEFWNTGSLGEGIKTITIPNDTEVSAVFYEWFTANAVEQKQISGKWKVNSTIQSIPYEVYKLAANAEERTFFIDTYGVNVVPFTITISGSTLTIYRIAPANNFGDLPDDSGQPTVLHDEVVVEGEHGGLSGFVVGVPSSSVVNTVVDFGTEPQSVSAEFYNWLTANATELVDISGKWRFREVLTPPADAFKETVSFLNGGESFNAMYAKTVADTTGFGLEFSSVTASGGEILLAYADGAYGDLFAVSGWADDTYRTVDFGTESQAVSAEFYNWLTGNAVQSNGSLLYRGETIAELFPGQTVTLKCGGMRMEDDVVVRV